MKPQQVIGTADDNELVDGVGYSHVEHEHCHYDGHNYYLPVSVSRMVAPMIWHQHCDHEVERSACEHDVSVDCEENISPSPDIIGIDTAKDKVGCFKDDWVNS